MTESATFHRVLVDTGPLVALRNPVDSQHRRCVEVLRLIQPPLLTCWPVETEAAWILRRNANLVRRMLKSIAQGTFAILNIEPEEISEIDALYAKYADLSPQLADITLLHLAQRENLDTVFTLDRRDFGIYRVKGKERLRLLPHEV